jgi:alpha-beta hydrolase superfamily lysophospholipase
MNHTSFNFSSKDGLNLFGRAWISQSPQPKGLLYLIHGLGEHSGRYADLADVLNQSGYHLVGFDLRGHGLSEGPRGHTPEYGMLLDDVERLIIESNNRFSFKLPEFLYGHSLGGNIVINYGLQRKRSFMGFIVTSPLLETTFEPPQAKLFAAKVFSQIMPSLTLKNGLETEALSRDEAIVQAYKDDPYVHDKLSAQLGYQMLQMGKYALSRGSDWEHSLLLMHGTADRICSAPASQIFARATGEKVDLVLWEDNYHELHNDLDKHKVIRKMVQWLDEQINQSPAPIA